LGSLLAGGQPEVEPEPKAATVPAEAEILVSEIRPNPHQPRETFEEGALEELRDSIRNHGVLQPVVVRRAESGFELIAGERRWRASKLAGLERIPAVIKEDVSDDQLLELALVENVQRRDLDVLEKAKGYRNLMDQLGLTQSAVAEKVGIQRSTVANHLRLLELPEDAQNALGAGLISMGHARALLGLKDPEAIGKALSRIVRKGLSVRQIEEHVQQIQDAQGRRTDPRKGRSKDTEGSTAEADEGGQQEPWVVDLQRQMQIHLGTRVRVQNREGYKGRISIEYYGREDLDRLIAILAPREEL